MTKNPKNSCHFRLGEVCKLTMGQSPASIYYNDNGVGLPFLQGKSEFQDIYPKPIKYCTQNLKIVMDGTILLSVRAPVGDVNIADQKYVIGRGLTGLTPLNENELDRWYLFFHLKKAKNEFEAKSSGSTFQSINKSIIENFTIPLLPISEQRAIVKVLRIIQDAIEIRKKKFNLQRELKEALMAHLFTYGTKNEPLKETEIGLIPESWELVKISEIAEVKSGGTPSRANPEYWNGSIPWVKTGEINYSTITETSEKISLTGLNNSAAKIIPKNTILVAMYGQGITRGRVAVLGIDAAVNQACAALINIDAKIKEFTYFFLEFSYNRLRDLGHGANQKNLNADIIKRFKCPKPSCKNECAQISNILSHCSKKILLIEKEISHFEELFQAMLEELMTGKVSTMPLIENCTVAS